MISFFWSSSNVDTTAYNKASRREVHMQSLLSSSVIGWYGLLRNRSQGERFMLYSNFDATALGSSMNSKSAAFRMMSSRDWTCQWRTAESKEQAGTPRQIRDLNEI